jgi:hypothetical protein
MMNFGYYAADVIDGTDFLGVELDEDFELLGFEDFSDNLDVLECDEAIIDFDEKDSFFLEDYQTYDMA